MNFALDGVFVVRFDNESQGLFIQIVRGLEQVVLHRLRPHHILRDRMGLKIMHFDAM